MKQFIILSLVVAFASATFFRSSVGSDDDIRIVQELFDGFWKQAGLAAPSNLAEKCLTSDDAQLFVQTVNLTLADLAKDNVYNAVATINKFNQQLPHTAKECLRTNPKTQQVYDAYHLTNYTLTQIETNVGAFIIAHFSEVRSDLQNANDNFQNGNYVQTGIDAGIFLKKAIPQ